MWVQAYLCIVWWIFCLCSFVWNQQLSCGGSPGQESVCVGVLKGMQLLLSSYSANLTWAINFIHLKLVKLFIFLFFSFFTSSVVHWYSREYKIHSACAAQSDLHVVTFFPLYAYGVKNFHDRWMCTERWLAFLPLHGVALFAAPSFRCIAGLLYHLT